MFTQAHNYYKRLFCVRSIIGKTGWGAWFLILLLGQLTPISLQAQVRWEPAEQRLKMKWDQTAASIHFTARNSGKQPVRIIEAAAGCGCVQLEAFDEFTLKPGSDWKLKGTYRPQGRQGPQFEQIKVAWDDGERHISTLNIVIDLPTVSRVVPGILQWPAKGPPSPQTTRIQWLGPGSAQLKADSQSGWKTVIAEVEKGKTWEVTTSPPENASTGMHQLPFSLHSGNTKRTCSLIAIIDES
jgi:hypothetical protein